MKAELTSENSVRKMIDFDIDKEVVSREIDKRAKSIAKKAQLPGFRPGKVPVAVVKRQFKADVEQDAVEAIANEVLPKELEAHNLRPLTSPKLEKVDLSADGSLKFRVTFDILPEVTIPAFRGIEVTVKKEAATPEMIDTEVNRLREAGARFEPAADRPAAKGDFVEVDIEITDHSTGQARKREATLIEIGHAGNHPELNAALEGVQSGETREVHAVERESDDPNSPVARVVDYHVVVRAIKVKVLPEKDDEFAKDLNFDNYAALETSVRERIERALKHNEDVAIEDAVLNKLADLATFDIPQSLVEEQVDARTRRFAENLQQQGIDLQKVNLDWAKVAAEQKEGSEKQVKLEILLDAIGKAEKVEATEEDIQDQIKRLAARARTSEAAISGRLDAEQRARLTAQARDRRIIDMIRAAARVNFE
ncbi:MAG: trigger factor [Vicinamibacteria bacterium]|nr:trigger factor [Vicinamibacteria bacterium]MBP9947025.1 trigger factor [Vicinamibacteria bacterium]